MTKTHWIIVGLGAVIVTAAVLAAGGPPAQVTICHVPPGNPANAHEITVSENAVPAHIAHGDNLGACAPVSPAR